MTKLNEQTIFQALIRALRSVELNGRMVQGATLLNVATALFGGGGPNKEALRACKTILSDMVSKGTILYVDGEPPFYVLER